jgi:mediator of RNA polymerase II transcription subunit 17
MAGNESLKDVTLRPWPPQKKEELSQDDLLLQIEQLTTERGHLRDITEKSLQEDIDSGKHVPEDVKDSLTKDDKDKDAPSKQQMVEKVFNAQREMYGHLEYALALLLSPAKLS